MSSNKEPMSSSYKVVFAYSLAMIFIVIIGGVLSRSKSIGFGIWYWSYIAWKMYKRDNDSLVSLQKVMLWFQSIAFSIVIGMILVSESTVKNYIKLSLIEISIIAIICIGATTFLYKFFRNQIILKQKIDSQINGDLSSDFYLWERVSDELKRGVRIDALWARVFAEADGDNNKANARYIRLRVEQLADSENHDSSNLKSIVGQSISRKLDIKTLTLSILLGVFLITGVLGSGEIKRYFLTNRSPIQNYLGVNLNSPMDEVRYALGTPSEVLYEDRTPFKMADGDTLDWALVVAKKEEISAKNGVNNFLYWQYNLPEYRIDLKFDKIHKRLISIGCYVSESSSYSPKECEVLGLKIKDEESRIVERLGKPSAEEFGGTTKTIYYTDLNIKLIFVKKRLYYILVESTAKPLESESTEPSNEAMGWTQESTGSNEIGPWLKYSPKGTRYCRYSNGTIYRLYPPGVKPNAEKVNQICFSNSTTTPQ